MAQRGVTVAALLSACGCALLQLACTVRHGTYAPTAVMLVVAAGVAIVAALRARGEVDARWLLAPVLLVVAAAIAVAEPLPGGVDDPAALELVPLAIGAIALSYLARVSAVLEHARFALVGVLAVMLGIGVFHASPHPHIDVFEMQARGADALLGGHDPYAVVSVTDSNNPAFHVPFTYPPVQLLAATLGWLAGDVRYAMLAGLVVAVVAARQIARRRGASSLQQDAAALLLVGSPVVAFVLDQAWVDLVPLGLVAAALWAYEAERPTLAAVLFGLGFAAKQPFVVGFPLLWFAGVRRREIAIAVVVAAATVLPFFAWSPADFWHSTVTYFADLPARGDALTLTNLVRVRFGVAPGELVGAAIAIGVLALHRRGRSPAALASYLAFALLCLFATGKLAFANYYFLISGLVVVCTPPSRPAMNAAANGVSG